MATTRLRVCAAAWMLWPLGNAVAQVSPFPPELLARIQQGVHDIYNLEYERAASNFERLIKEAPNDPAGYAYLAFTYWVQELNKKQGLSIDRFAASDFFSELPKYALQPDPSFEARFRQASERAIETAQALLQKNPDDRAALFVRGVAYQNLASFEIALRRSWWSAFRYGSKTYRDHRELLRRDPNFHDAQLSTGVYNYVAGSVSWTVKCVGYLLGYRGDKARGKQDLETAADKALLVGDDARVILILINTREKNYPKALEYLSQLRQRYSQNYLAPLDMAGLALRMKQPEKAIAIYEEILRKREAGEPKFAELERAALYNRLGVAFRGKGDLIASAGWFGKSLVESRASARSLTLARLELGKTLDLQGRRDEALAQYNTVAAAEDVAGSQQEAKELLRRSFRP